jgi:hypothetical protein
LGAGQQNAHVEIFPTGGCEKNVLTVSWFQSLFNARRKIALWKIEV